MKSFSLIQTLISSMYAFGSVVRSPGLPKEMFHETALSGETFQGCVAGAWGRSWQLSRWRLCHLLDMTTWDGALVWALPRVDHVLRAEQASLQCPLQRRENCNKALYRWNRRLLHFWSCSEPWLFPAGRRAMELLEGDLNQGGSAGGFSQTAVSHKMVLWDKGHWDTTTGPL